MITKAPPRVYAGRWNVRASGFGGTQTADGNTASGTNTPSSRIGGVAVGADYHLSAQTVVGFAMAGGATNFSVAGGGGGRSDLFQVGGFVRQSIASAYITASAAYGWQQVTAERNVGAESLRARFDTNSYSARLEAGNRYATPWLGIALTPYAAAGDVSRPAGLCGDHVVGIDDLRTGLGRQGHQRAAANSACARTSRFSSTTRSSRGRAAWAYDFNTDRSASATFQSLPGASFVVGGASPAANAALTTAAAQLTFRNGITLGTTFEGEFSEVTRYYAGRCAVRYNW
ncbi:MULTISPECIES: autotransporter outer membrane beta-barrel domain-containing protein [unclassified Tardiphaga]|uniref:autotransporter outer membrane beta-barrel domain-containing protein n=1 Tax=unclassified Tardiphaga TaxID=2631404 RepID=UPI001FEE64A5|nr:MULTISPECIES: autotransporter outer membrane beta-barrel domain-containing protein [unclassified Tardiphaga]